MTSVPLLCVGAPWKLTYLPGRWPGGKESGTKQTALAALMREGLERSLTHASARKDRERPSYSKMRDTLGHRKEERKTERTTTTRKRVLSPS